MLFRSETASAAICAAAIMGCSNHPVAAGSDTPVAKFAGGSISVADADAHLAAEPAALRALWQSPQQKKAFVERMAKVDILAQEASKRGLDKTVEFQDGVQRLLIDQLQKQVENENAQVPEAELRAYYVQHISDYVKPPRIAVQDLLVAAPAGTDPKSIAARVAAKAAATKLLGKLRAEQAKLDKAKTPLARLPLFGMLAHQNSADEKTSKAGGEAAFMSQQDLTNSYGPEFAKAALALTPEAPLGAIVETPKGFYVVRLTARLEGKAQAFADPKTNAQVRDRYLAESRTKRFEDYTQKLTAAAGVTIDDAALAQVVAPAAINSPVGDRPRRP